MSNEDLAKISYDSFMDKNSFARERANLVMRELKGLLTRLMPRAGDYDTAIPNFFLFRRDCGNIIERCLNKPLASFMVQGAKRIQVGRHELDYDAGQSMIITLDMPTVSFLMKAGPSHPCLSVFFYLDRNIIADILTEMEPGETTAEDCPSPISIAEAEPDFIDGMLRLTGLLEKKEQIAFRAPLIYREMHYLLLLGPHKNTIKGFFAKNAPNHLIFRAIAYLNSHIATPVRIEELTEMTHMSESTLYRHFKSVTGYSPLQYHKELKLHEARRIMRNESMAVGEAAFRVGYESVTQFTREYKRLFGESPHRDVYKSKFVK